MRRSRSREALPDGRRGPSTDLHSPAGVRPKFGHSLEHIVLRKKPPPPPPPPRKETEAGGVAAPLIGPAPPARAPAEGFWPRESDSLARTETRNRRVFARAASQKSIHPARVENRSRAAVATPRAGATSARSLCTCAEAPLWGRPRPALPSDTATRESAVRVSPLEL